jgi:hypothetical protein
VATEGDENETSTMVSVGLLMKFITGCVKKFCAAPINGNNKIPNTIHLFMMIF